MWWSVCLCGMCMVTSVFFFKQKTAYELRISDWSSDVCSSDLVEAEAARPVSAAVDIAQLNFDYQVTGDRPAWRPLRAFDDGRQTWIEFPAAISTGEAPDRKSVV